MFLLKFLNLLNNETILCIQVLPHEKHKQRGHRDSNVGVFFLFDSSQGYEYLQHKMDFLRPTTVILKRSEYNV